MVCLAVANEATENLINAEAFARMRRDAVFINVSRGNLVDEAALAAALAEGKSPAPRSMSAVRRTRCRRLRIAALPNVIATPHIGGLTPPAIEAQALNTVEQVRALVSRRGAGRRRQYRNLDPQDLIALRRPTPRRSDLTKPRKGAPVTRE